MRMNLKGLVIALAYGCSSASMTFINKAMLNTYQYNHPLSLMVAQMLFTIIIMEVLILTGFVCIPRYSLEKGKVFLLPSLLYAGNSVLALSALSGMNVPMYSVLKRCVPVTVLFLSIVMLKKSLPSPLVFVSIFMITAGCILTGLGDLAFDLWAYSYGLTSVVLHGTYLVLVQRVSQSGEEKMTASLTLYLNSYNTLPVFLVASLASGEVMESVKHFKYDDPGFLAVFILTSTMGCLLNYTAFLCTTENSALTTSVTGVLKSILQVVIGIFTFGGISLNSRSVGGIIINTVGGALYTFAKYIESRRPNSEEVKLESGGST